MNKKSIFSGLVLLLLCYSPSSWAFVDIEYITYGQFTETVNAFRRTALALSFSSNGGSALIFSFLGIGVLSAFAINTTSMLSGQSKVQQWAFMTFLGIALTAGGVLPKNTVHVYDKTLNKYEAVGDVPSLVVATAGISNLITELFKYMTDLSYAYAHDDISSSSPFVIMQKATESPGSFYDSHLINSIANYYNDCAPLAVNQGRVNIEELRSGTESISTELAKMQHNVIHTEYYDSSSPYGELITCTEAWNNINSSLQNENSFTKHMGSICSAISLDINKPAELQQCREKVASSFTAAFDLSGTVTFQTALSNTLLATAIEQAITNGNPELALEIQANRKQLAQSAGMWSLAGQYMPAIKGFIFSNILMVTPFLLLMMVTPLIGNAIKTFLGLFAFYTIWEILDLSVVASMQDQIYAATYEMTQHKMGLLGIWAAPTESIKTLGILGQSRSIATTLATFICVALFKISAHSLANVASKGEAAIENDGKQLGEKYLMSENQGNALNELSQGNSNLMTIGQSGGVLNHSVGSAANATVANLGGQLNASVGNLDQLALGNSHSQQNQATSAAKNVKDYGGLESSAQQIGTATSTQTQATTNAVNNNDNALDILTNQKAGSMARTQGEMDAAAENGTDYVQQQENNAYLAAKETDGQTNELIRQEGSRERAGDVATNVGRAHAADKDALSHVMGSTPSQGGGYDNRMEAKVAEEKKRIVASTTEATTARDNGTTLAEQTALKTEQQTIEDIATARAKDGMFHSPQEHAEYTETQVKQNIAEERGKQQGNQEVYASPEEQTDAARKRTMVQKAEQDGHAQGVKEVLNTPEEITAHEAQKTAQHTAHDRGVAAATGEHYETNEQISKHAHDQTEVQLLDEDAGLEKRAALQESLNFNDEQMARALAGDMDVRLNPLQQQAAIDAGFLPEDAYRGDSAIVTTLHNVVEEDENGKSLLSAGSETHSGDSVTTNNNAQYHNEGLSTNNATQSMQDADYMDKVYRDAKEKGLDPNAAVANAYMDGIGGAFSIHKTNDTVDNKSASGSLGLNFGFGSRDKGLSGSFGGDVSYTKQNVDTRQHSVDETRTHLTEASQRIDDYLNQEVRLGNINANELDKERGEMLADFGKHLQGMMAGTEDNPLSQNGADPIQNNSSKFIEGAAPKPENTSQKSNWTPNKSHYM